MDPAAALEAILFVAESPVPEAELSQVLELPPQEVERALAALAERLSESGSGLVLRESGGVSPRHRPPPGSRAPLSNRSPSSPTGSRSHGARSARSGESTRNRPWELSSAAA